MRYLAAAEDTDNLFPIAIGAALVTAAIELPISQFYATVPPTNTPKRMAIAGGMAFVSVLIAGAIVKLSRR